MNKACISNSITGTFFLNQKLLTWLKQGSW